MGKESEEKNKNIFEIAFPNNKGVKLLDFKEIIWDKEGGRARVSEIGCLCWGFLLIFTVALLNV